jgi:hypothetical protein
MLSAQLGEQEAQEVINLGQGGHGRAPTGVAHPLFYGHCGGQSRYDVDIGSLEDLNILSNIGGEAFQVPALTFGKKDVKGQRRFARPGNPR